MIHVTRLNTAKHQVSCCAWVGSITSDTTLQHTATHCNTLQHTATHYNTLHITSDTTPAHTLCKIIRPEPNCDRKGTSMYRHLNTCVFIHFFFFNVCVYRWENQAGRDPLLGLPHVLDAHKVLPPLLCDCVLCSLLSLDCVHAHVRIRPLCSTLTYTRAQYIYTHIYTQYIYTHTLMHTHAHTCTHMHAHVHIYMHTYTQLGSRIHDLSHTHIHAHTHMHTHTCTHTHAHTYVQNICLLSHTLTQSDKIGSCTLFILHINTHVRRIIMKDGK